MTESKAVVTIDDISEANAPAIYVKGGLLQFLEAVKVEVAAEVPDLTTRKGRDRIASLAAKVSKSKVAVEKPGREYLARLKEMPKTVEAELREFVRSMDALRDDTRAPLTQWEEAETKRVSCHEFQIKNLHEFSICDGLSADGISAAMQTLEAITVDSRFEEFEAEAHRAKAYSLTALRDALVIREKHESELAAIAKFQAEQAEREQKERDARIAREAAEKAQREADASAQAYRENVAREAAEAEAAAKRREAELVDKAAQAQRQADQDKRDAAAAAEQARLNFELSEQRRVAAEKQAEIDRLADQKRAEQQRIDAERRQAEAVKRAAAAERQRQEDEFARVEAEAKEREADRAHKSRINRDALDALVAAGMPEACAKQAVTLIAKRQIPHITISY